MTITGKKLILLVFGYAVLMWSLFGCGVQDAAMVISVEESAGRIDTSQDTMTYSGNPEIFNGSTEDGALDSLDCNNADTIFVYVCGAVAEPGVVELTEGSRAETALQAAGGFAPDAQTDYVNLAAKVSDGEKLYFPSVGEAEALAMEEKNASEGLVNINTADEEKLCTLPGIGASRAQDIIAYREAHGAFRSKEDIMKVPGIKENAYSRLCEKIVTE